MEAAVDAAIEEMPEDFAIKAFLVANQTEVKGMFLSAYDEEKDREKALKEQERLIQKKESQVNERVAMDMIKEKMPLEMIKKISRLSEEHIRKLAKSMGAAVVSGKQGHSVRKYCKLVPQYFIGRVFLRAIRTLSDAYSCEKL